MLELKISSDLGAEIILKILSSQFSVDALCERVEECVKEGYHFHLKDDGTLGTNDLCKIAWKGAYIEEIDKRRGVYAHGMIEMAMQKYSEMSRINQPKE